MTNENNNINLKKTNKVKKIIFILIVILTVFIIKSEFKEYYPYLFDGVFVTNDADYIDYEKEIDGLIYKGNTSDLIDNTLYYFNGWERHIQNALADFITKTNGDQGVFLDIGANIGLHSLPMAKHAKDIIAIEPYPPVVARFHEMVELNHIGNIHIYPVGYSNTNGSLPFYAPPDDNQGTGSFENDFKKDNHLLGNLPLVVGDEHLAGEGIDKIDLIKIDIEGFERYALQGLENTLEKNRPIVVMELNNSEGGFNSKKQLLETFPPKYQFFILRKGSKEGFKQIYSFTLGDFGYLFGPLVRGDYRLEPFDYIFTNQVNLACVPEERTNLVSNLNVKPRT